jgi:predicted amidohydrolase
MSIDQRGDGAAERLRDTVASGLPTTRMLDSVRRTRMRRRVALSSVAAVVAVCAVVLATTVPQRDEGAPVKPGPSSPTRANGAVFGYGTDELLHPAGLDVPPLSISSTPTWAPDGSRVAVLAGGILVTDVHTGRTDLLPCPGCSEISWSPDGRTIAAATSEGDGSPLLLVDVDASTLRSVALPGIDRVSSLTWAPDSRRLAFLAVLPVAAKGAWTVTLDGSRPQRFVHGATGLLRAHPGRPAILALRWAPDREEVAALKATYDAARQTYLFDVETMHPDGSSVARLVGNGTCTCAGWGPSLVWSPDGRILLISSRDRRSDQTRLDGDGRSIDVRFAAGASGAISWQPLPR